MQRDRPTPDKNIPYLMSEVEKVKVRNTQFITSLANKNIGLQP